MTITSTVARNDYTGSDTVGPYAYTFRIFNATDLEVIVRDTNDLEIPYVYQTDYTVSGVGNRTGGNVTFVDEVPLNYAISIRRVVPVTQQTNLRNQGQYYPETVEDTFDVGVMIDQQQQDQMDRSVYLSETYDPADYDLQLPAPSASKAIVWNVAGTGFDNATLSAVQLSAWNASQNMILDSFADGVDFTAGVTTALTLSADPGNITNVTVLRRTSGNELAYLSDEYSVSGTTLTFDGVIPAGTTEVEVKYLYTYQVNRVAAANIVNQIASEQADYTPTWTGAVTRNLRTRLMDYLSVADFGATGDGVTDDTAAITAAITAATVAGGNVYFNPGTYLISGDLNVPVDVSLSSQGSPMAQILGSGTERIVVTGQPATQRGGGKIERLYLNGVGIILGKTGSDYGVGSTLRGLEIYGVTGYGVTYRHHSYLTLLDDCNIHDCSLAGVWFDFTGAATDAGANMVIRNSRMFDMAVGVLITGLTADGCSLVLQGCDLEGTTTAAVKSTGMADGVLHIRGCHFENNTAYSLDLVGGNVFLDGFDCFPSGTTHTAFVKLNGAGGGTGTRLWMSHGRLQWESGKLCELYDKARLIIDSDTVFGAPAFFGLDAYPMANAAVAQDGYILNGGMGYAERGGKVFAGRSGESATVIYGDPVVTLTTIQKFDYASRVIEFDFSVTIGAAGTNILRVYLNGDTSQYVDISLAVASGVGHARVMYTPGGIFSVFVVYNAMAYSGSFVDTSGYDCQRFVDAESVSTGPAGSTFDIVALCEDVR